MKTILSNIIIFFSFFSLVHAQSTKSEWMLSGSPADDIKHLLLPGIYFPNIINLNPHISSRQVELTAKTMKALKNNSVWFTDTFPFLTAIDTAYLAKKFGLTINEYTEYLNLSSKPSIVYSNNDTLFVIKKNNMLSFKGTGKLVVLDSLQYDIDNNTASFKKYKLSFKRKSEEKDDDGSPFPTARTGYVYEYIDSKNISSDEIPDLKKMTVTSLELEISQLTANKKTMIIFTGFQFLNGVQKFLTTLYFELN
jgi:hypothetical protein